MLACADVYLAEPMSDLLAALFRLSLLLLPLAVLADGAVDHERQRIRLTLSSEPPNLNSTVTTDQISSFVLSHVMEGLLTYDASNELSPGVAERWELRQDGATFWLRRNARWSDGKPVTAHDFVFAWRTAVDPKTASQYASALYPVRNAERINRGELPVTALGVEARGDFRLEVTFERPTPYFLGLTAFFTYYPIRQDFYESRGERYAADADDLLYNGPFVLQRWVHGAHLRLRRNGHYWGRDHVGLYEIDIPYITTDTTAIFNLYQAGSIALAPLETETLRDAVRLGFTPKLFLTGSIYYLQFNLREGRITTNRNLRKAIQAILDPAVLVNKVVGLPGNLPSDSIFPTTVKGVELPFRTEYPAPRPERGLGLARHYLELARQELGLERIPPLVMLVGDGPRANKEAEYFQQLFARGLGLDVRLDRQTAKQRLDKMSRGDFDIVAAGWGPDYDDPMTFGDLFASWNENNRGRYRNPEYDRWVEIAATSPDPEQRMRAFAEMQRLLMEDVPVLPLYESGNVYLQHPQLRGVVRAIFGGDPNLRYAYVAGEDE